MEKSAHRKFRLTVLSFCVLTFACNEKQSGDPGVDRVRKPVRAPGDRLNAVPAAGPRPVAGKEALRAENEQRFNEILDRIHSQVANGQKANIKDIEAIRLIL